MLAGLAVACCASADLTGVKVSIRFTSQQTCLIGDVEVACSDVGSKLKAMHVPANADIHLNGDETVKYALVSSAVNSLRNAGYSTKVGVLTRGSK